ncbi:Uncharacterised protein [Mycobacteroides abscessus subsp. abscessus]|nr:Uncharacterised protein [Mycobacteroides abscessus subsp. abscessus]SKU85456.1 Uncharacterised protein [Mycobacteroides abscessus subsp. abscessus]
MLPDTAFRRVVENCQRAAHAHVLREKRSHAVGIVVIRVFVSTGTKMAMVEQPDTQREDPTASGAPRVEILIDVRT